jgi:hypothetical protein
MAHDAHRENLLRRIAALSQKTIENGCTEAEALAAAEHVDRLLRAHNLTLDEISLEREELSVAEIRTGKKVRHPVDMVVPELTRFTGTLVQVSALRDGGLTYRFFGLRADTLLAGHLLRVIHGAMEREVRAYLADRRGASGTSIGDGLRRRSSFLYGMSDRVSDRLVELREAREGIPTATGRDLVVVKDALVRRRAAELGFDASEFSIRSYYTSERDFDAGRAAGDRVGLGSPVEGPGKPVALLGKS